MVSISQVYRVDGVVNVLFVTADGVDGWRRAGRITVVVATLGRRVFLWNVVDVNEVVGGVGSDSLATS